MTKEEIRDELIEIKAIADYESDDPFVGVYLDELHKVFEKNGKDEFYNGIWCCIQDLVAVYCEPTLATDILNASGMSIEEIEKAQEVSGCYDVQMSAFIEQLKMTAKKKKSGNTSYKDISELSVEVKNKIYELRFPCDKNVTIDEYIGHYCLIVVDDVAYVGDDEFSHKLLKQWLLTDSKIKKTSLAHAIIVNNHVIKNRFGITNNKAKI